MLSRDTQLAALAQKLNTATHISTFECQETGFKDEHKVRISYCAVAKLQGSTFIPTTEPLAANIEDSILRTLAQLGMTVPDKKFIDGHMRQKDSTYHFIRYISISANAVQLANIDRFEKVHAEVLEAEKVKREAINIAPTPSEATTAIENVDNKPRYSNRI